MVPILRAGLMLLEKADTLLPTTQTYHVGYVRDDDTLEVGAGRLLQLLRVAWTLLLRCAVQEAARLACRPPHRAPPRSKHCLTPLPTYTPSSQASCYLNKLPPSFSPTDRVLVSDPMLATGGTLDKVCLGAHCALVRPHASLLSGAAALPGLEPSCCSASHLPTHHNRCSPTSSAAAPRRT